MPRRVQKILSWELSLSPAHFYPSCPTVSTPRITGDRGDRGEVSSDLEAGQILAVLIDSTVLGAPIWFALREDWKPDEDDSTPVFYASELPMLRKKTVEQLQKIYALKIGPKGLGTKVRQ